MGARPAPKALASFWELIPQIELPCLDLTQGESLVLPRPDMHVLLTPTGDFPLSEQKQKRNIFGEREEWGG